MHDIPDKQQINIFKRKSVREFREGSIDKKLIEFALESAMQAPSANNNQPWAFIVIEHKKTLGRISSEFKYGYIIQKAPCAILVCGLPHNEGKKDEFWVQSCSAATENILLALTELELGSVWLGIYPRENRINVLKDILNIPEDVVPFSLIVLGYPKAASSEVISRYDTSKIHFEYWSR